MNGADLPQSVILELGPLRRCAVVGPFTCCVSGVIAVIVMSFSRQVNIPPVRNRIMLYGIKEAIPFLVLLSLRQCEHVR